MIFSYKKRRKMKLSNILYNDLTSKEINYIFESKLYLKENNKELNTTETQKVSYVKFKSVYLPKIIKFLNTKVKNNFNKKEIYKYDKDPLGSLSKVTELNKLCFVEIPGLGLKLDPYNIKDIKQGVNIVDIEKYKINQIIPFMIKDKENSVLGAENSSNNGTVYIIEIPPLFTEILDENIEIQSKLFKRAKLSYEKKSNSYYYEEYTVDNVSFKMLDKQSGHVDMYKKVIKGQKSPLYLNTLQTRLKGTKNSGKEKTISDK